MSKTKAGGSTRNGRGLIIGDIFSNNSVDTDLLETDVVVE